MQGDASEQTKKRVLFHRFQKWLRSAWWSSAPVDTSITIQSSSSEYDSHPSASRKPFGRAYSKAGVVPTRNANPLLCRHSSRRTRILVSSIAQRVELSCTTRSSRTSPSKRIKDGGTRKLPTVVKFLEHLAGLRRRQPSFSLPRMVVPFLTTPCHSLRLEPAISACSHYIIR